MSVYVVNVRNVLNSLEQKRVWASIIIIIINMHSTGVQNFSLFFVLQIVSNLDNDLSEDGSAAHLSADCRKCKLVFYISWIYRFISCESTVLCLVRLRCFLCVCVCVTKWCREWSNLKKNCFALFVLVSKELWMERERHILYKIASTLLSVRVSDSVFMS